MTPILTVGPKPLDKRNTNLEGDTIPKRQRTRKKPTEPKGPRATKARKPRQSKKRAIAKT